MKNKYTVYFVSREEEKIIADYDEVKDNVVYFIDKTCAGKKDSVVACFVLQNIVGYVKE